MDFGSKPAVFFLPYRALTGWIFWARSQNCENRLLGLSCLSIRPSICLSAWNNSAPTERIVMKFVLSIFIKSVEKFQGSLKFDKNNR